MEKDIEFNQLLFSLPEELYNKIYDIYRKMYIFPEIRKKHNKIHINRVHPYRGGYRLEKCFE